MQESKGVINGMIGTKGNYWDIIIIWIEISMVSVIFLYNCYRWSWIDYPVGIFLKPPQKPSDPSPADDKENVGLKLHYV